MEEKNLEGQQLMSEEEFQTKIDEIAANNRKQIVEDFNNGILYLRNFAGVSKYKSIRRAIRKGHVSIWGDIYPKRPYNNRKSNPQRKKLREIYDQVTKRI